jgi:membrane protein YdbS with pleckstrin-like domain
VAAGILDVGLYFVGKAFGAKLQVAQHGSAAMAPIPPFMPMVNCVMGALVAAAVMAALVRFAGENAWRIFLGVAVVVFVLFSTLPVVMLPADTLSVVFLEIMHIPAVIGIVGGIRRFGRG